MQTTLGSDRIRDEVLLVARILLVMLFLIFGWSKLMDYSGTVATMMKYGLPMPPVAAAVAIVMEFFVSIAIILGVWTRPFTVLLGLYTVATGFVGHPYWRMTGAEQLANEIEYYKNVSIMGGLLLLYITGAGKYSLDARLGLGMKSALA